MRHASVQWNCSHVCCFLPWSFPPLVRICSLHVWSSLSVHLAGHAAHSAACGVLLRGAGPGVFAASHQYCLHGSGRSPMTQKTQNFYWRCSSFLQSKPDPEYMIPAKSNEWYSNPEHPHCEVQYDTCIQRYIERLTRHLPVVLFPTVLLWTEKSKEKILICIKMWIII